MNAWPEVKNGKMIVLVPPYARTTEKLPLLYFHSCPQCPKLEMNEEEPSKFKFHFTVLLVPCPMKKKLSEKSFVFGLPR